MNVGEFLESANQFVEVNGVRGLFSELVNGSDVSFESKYIVNVDYDYDIDAVVIVADGGYEIGDGVDEVKLNKAFISELKSATLSLSELLMLLDEYEDDDLVVIKAYTNMQENDDDFFLIENLEFNADTNPGDFVILGEID